MGILNNILLVTLLVSSKESYILGTNTKTTETNATITSKKEIIHFGLDTAQTATVGTTPIKNNDHETNYRAFSKNKTDEVLPENIKNIIPTTVSPQVGAPKPYELIGSGVRRRRRQTNYKDDDSDDSNSREKKDWKKEWKARWQQKKLKALNSTTTTPKGGVMNMVAARPWGKPCSDPKAGAGQEGTCTLPLECDKEFRLYRADYDCGMTGFVCCNILPAEYDMYQAIDPSFETSIEREASSSETEERKGKKKKKDDKKKKKKIRAKRKKRIKKAIRKIDRAIKKIVKKLERNTNKERRWKTKQWQEFVKHLKKEYKKEKKQVVAHHSDQMKQIDAELMLRLKQMALLNKKFAENKAFRDMIVTGHLNDRGVRMLIEEYPDMEPMLRSSARRGGGDVGHQEYDLTNEYGLLYY